jgi:hypothetical protein
LMDGVLAGVYLENRQEVATHAKTAASCLLTHWPRKKKPVRQN